MLVALALGGCAGTAPSATPYQPAAEEGAAGYSGQALAPGRVRIAFAGNRHTPRETVETYLLYRAAEVTLHQGFDHFVVTESDTERFTRTRPVGPRMSLGVGYGRGWGCCSGSRSILAYRYGVNPWDPFWSGRYGHPFYDPVYDPRPVATEHRYTAHAVVAMGKGPPPAGNAAAYDARAVIATLGPRVTPPPPEPPLPARGPPGAPPVPPSKPAPPAA
ncbi:CC0125/CC1285 family lipoprotein [Roseospira goensis]|uniref:Lipoprotein n=1 Tax=Roseospira goensis TaxID=391922 RepID=A0A7W6RZP5_9PROT|nr:hypothetical protein [Roseospira goensis]MBB4285579.1 hypothetical protein [Roseospira goensis]